MKRHLTLFTCIILMILSVTVVAAAEQNPTITIGFTTETSTATEGTDDTAVEVYAIIEGGTVEGTFTVDLTVTDMGTTPGADYEAVDSTYTITCPINFGITQVPCSETNPGEPITENTLTLINDEIFEQSESVMFTISNPQGTGLIIGEFNTHTLTILDDDPQPDLIRTYPTDSATIDGGPEWARFTFEHNSNAAWYRIWIGNPTGPSNYDEWVPAFDWQTDNGVIPGICNDVSNICTVPADIYLIDGDYAWWMTYYSTEDLANEFNLRWSGSTFTVAFGQIPPIIRTNPANTLPGSIEWTYDDAALYYQLWVGLIDGSLSLIYDWYPAADICQGMTCSINTSGLTFPQGDYQWWMEAWGPGEYDRWAVNGSTDFSQVNP